MIITFACEFSASSAFNTTYQSQKLLNFHKKHSNKNQPAPFNDSMNIDGQPSHIFSEEDDEIELTEFYECKDCHRKFLPEDHLIYLAHCRDVHPKKVSCSFRCMVAPTRKKKKPRPGKLFKNMYYLANHLQNIHFAAVK